MSKKVKTYTEINKGNSQKPLELLRSTFIIGVLSIFNISNSIRSRETSERIKLQL